MRRLRGAGIVTIAVMFGMTACSGSASSTGAGAKSSPRADTVTGTPSPSHTPSPPITLRQLRSAALLLDQVPAGYHVETALKIDHSKASPFCNSKFRRVKPRHRLEELFWKGDYGPGIGEIVEDYKTPALALKALGQTQRAANSCRSWVDSDDGTTEHLSALSFPQLGDRSFAVYLKIDVPNSVEITGQHAFIAVGRALIHVSVQGATGLSSIGNLPVRMAKIAVADLEKRHLQ
jgi:hypothetical protein